VITQICKLREWELVATWSALAFIEATLARRIEFIELEFWGAPNDASADAGSYKEIS
jgi:hypothetical protein